MHSLRKACKDATLEQLREGHQNISNIIADRQQRKSSENESRKEIPEDAKYKYFDSRGQTHYWDGEGEAPMDIQRRLAIGAKLEDFLLKD